MLTVPERGKEIIFPFIKNSLAITSYPLVFDSFKDVE